MRWSLTCSRSGSSPEPSARMRSRSVTMPGPGCSGSRITAAPTLCSDMKRAASRRVRPGVIVSTCSVIASRTFTAAPLPLRVDLVALRHRDHTQSRTLVATPPCSVRAPPAGEVGRAPQVAPEGRVADDADVPRAGLLGRGRDREVADPVRALVVERDELVGRERAAEPAAQLVLDPPGAPARASRAARAAPPRAGAGPRPTGRARGRTAPFQASGAPAGAAPGGRRLRRRTASRPGGRAAPRPRTPSRPRAPSRAGAPRARARTRACRLVPALAQALVLGAQRGDLARASPWPRRRPRSRSAPGPM